MDIAAWLDELGLGQYAQAFRDNEIDERVLPSLTAEDLKDLGVQLVGHRRRCPTSCTPRSLRSSAVRLGNTRSSISLSRNARWYWPSLNPPNEAAISMPASLPIVSPLYTCLRIPQLQLSRAQKDA